MFRLSKNDRFVSRIPAGRSTFGLRDGVREYVIRLDTFHRVNGFLEHVLYGKPKSTYDQIRRLANLPTSSLAFCNRTRNDDEYRCIGEKRH